MSMCLGAPGDQKRRSNSLELGTQAVVSQRVGAATESASSVRALSDLRVTQDSSKPPRMADSLRRA